MRRILLSTLVASLFLPGLPNVVHAGVISTEAMLIAQQRAASVERVNAFFLRGDVRAELVRLGVDPNHALKRVEALTASELIDLENKINEMPAGGVIEVIGIVAVVFIILELTGVTNVFTNF
jgi:hypothetical protein